MRDRLYKRRHNNLLAGLILLAVGGVWLMKQVGFFIPAWLFSWPMILIIVGLFVGARNNFRDFGWLIMVGIGIYFLLDKWWPDLPTKHYLWPVIIIGAGLFLIFFPRRNVHWGWGDKMYEMKEHEGVAVKEKPAETETPRFHQPTEVLDIVSIFAAFKKMVYSKNFNGGDVVCIFGGAEVDLTQADFKGIVVIDMVHIFGGSKLIVPPNWEVRTEAAVIFGGVEDKRRNPMVPFDKDKLVILKGVVIFGGVELKSY